MHFAKKSNTILLCTNYFIEPAVVLDKDMTKLYIKIKFQNIDHIIKIIFHNIRKEDRI